MYRWYQIDKRHDDITFTSHKRYHKQPNLGFPTVHGSLVPWVSGAYLAVDVETERRGHQSQHPQLGHAQLCNWETLEARNPDVGRFFWRSKQIDCWSPKWTLRNNIVGKEIIRILWEFFDDRSRLIWGKMHFAWCHHCNVQLCNLVE